MYDSLSDENDGPTRSPRKYRLQFRNRNGLQGREAMIVCQNFRVSRHNNLMYTDLHDDVIIIQLNDGDYFDVKVMG